LIYYAIPSKAEDASPPTTYELMINGESFVVNLNRGVRLQSKEKPGVTYDVALRIALQQRLVLNTVQFLYDWPAKVEDDQRSPQRRVTIRHELGYTMFITDLGRPLEPAAQEETFNNLKDSVARSLQGSGVENLVAAEPHTRRFDACDARGTVLRYRDQQGFDHMCLVYLLTGPTFACTCVAQFFQSDEMNVKPRIKTTLDTLGAIR